MNKPILALFSLLFIASASCIPLNLPEDDFAPASRSINAPRATPATTFRTPASTIKDQTGRQANKMLELVEDDEDFIDDDLDEDFIAAPSASVTVGKVTVSAFKNAKPMNFHTKLTCYQDCKKSLSLYCSIKYKLDDKQSITQNRICSKYCKVYSC